MGPDALAGRAVRAFVRRDLAIALSYRVPFLLEFLPAVFAVFTYFFVSKIVAPGAIPGGYLAFVVVGLAVAELLVAGTARATRYLRDEQLQGTLEVTLASGIRLRSFAAGVAAYPLLAAAVRAVVYVLLGVALGAGVGGANWGLAVAVVALASVAFAGLGLVATALVLVFHQAAAATAWLVSLMTLAGGQLFPPGLLPEWVERVADVSPFTPALRLGRRAILNGESWSDAGRTIAWLGGLTVLYVAVGILALAAGLRRARRTGTLAGY